MSDEGFEIKHIFIQWAFPIPESSNQVSNAPVLNLETAMWLAEKPQPLHTALWRTSWVVLGRSPSSFALCVIASCAHCQQSYS